MPRQDILLFMSDQHNPLLSGFMGGIARTPNLAEMAAQGTSYTAAYTPCPLCVPARMAFLSGRLPSKTGILTNATTLPGTTPTIAHAMAAAGYETVLVGRMHFTGPDQRHGFQHRLVGDMTNVTWKPDRELQEQTRGVYQPCFGEPGCTKVIGGGTSPVLEYDEAVVAAALEWLARPHKKPQFIVVGTYGPHFPYVAPPEKYTYYKQRVSLPPSFDEAPEWLDPAQRVRADRATRNPEDALRAMAAYCGMIEQTDEHLGTVRAAFQQYCAKNGRAGTLVYTSDHGDMVGERRLFGKMSLFEGSARIPLLMEGEGIPKAQVRQSPVSLLDMAPTLCALAGAPALPGADGADILAQNDAALAERPVISEVFGVFGMAIRLPQMQHMNSLSRMVRKGRYKYINRHNFEEWDMLFDLQADPGETHNLAAERPEMVRQLAAVLQELPSPEAVARQQENNWDIFDLMQAAECPDAALQQEFWIDTSPEARVAPPLT